MIIGGHPHVVQPLRLTSDRYAPGRVTVYSLGNLISNMKTRDTRGVQWLKCVCGATA